MAAELRFGRNDLAKAVQRALPPASLYSPAADEDRFLLRGVNRPGNFSASNASPRNSARDGDHRLNVTLEEVLIVHRLSILHRLKKQIVRAGRFQDLQSGNRS